MKQGHVGLIFLIIWLACFSLLFFSKEKYRSAQAEKEQIERALLEAITYAGEEYSSVMNDNLEKKQATLESSFFEALYVSMGVFECEEEREILKMHVPMMMIAEEDGISFYHIKEITTDGIKEFSYAWTQKTEYPWKEDITKEEKKQKIMELLETKASEIISRHNYIAEQYGISYSFSVPRFLQDTADEIHFPMLFIVFQGWPLTTNKDIFYENCIDAGVFLQEVKQYIVTVSNMVSDTRSLYHKRNCSFVTQTEVICISGMMTKEEAVRNYGAFPCEICNP